MLHEAIAEGACQVLFATEMSIGHGWKRTGSDCVNENVFIGWKSRVPEATSRVVGTRVDGKELYHDAELGNTAADLRIETKGARISSLLQFTDPAPRIVSLSNTLLEHPGSG